ncbi:prenylated Rab acceptor protein 1-like isoform X2 [Haliotis rufescens]|uniref:prenylated Rab acceptor protein 1-like isoform X1 n=1 Tax=Haliotis rufescens TaxID=6454 RepID=UPI00201EBB00|nr:prenylated Rab acceptor protein 1-like isoform X1 [Haliotis rufescens]XP_048254107.1 prenylated Rab acceptor protein 1-like isoform X2 [Haliotis rufescens]
MAEKSGLEGNIDIPLIEPASQSFKQRMMSMSVSNIAVREWFSKTREGVKPWGEFINTSKFRLPKTVAPIPKRVMKNIENFQGNYLFVFMGLVIFCVLTSPMLLVALAACLGACYIISLKNATQKLAILGREVTVAQQYACVGVLSFPLFWLAGAGSAVFWVIGASFFVIMLHATLHVTAEEAEAFDIDMDEVSIAT